LEKANAKRCFVAFISDFKDQYKYILVIAHNGLKSQTRNSLKKRPCLSTTEFHLERKTFLTIFLKRADVKYDSELCIFYSSQKRNEKSLKSLSVISTLRHILFFYCVTQYPFFEIKKIKRLIIFTHVSSFPSIFLMFNI